MFFFSLSSLSFQIVLLLLFNKISAVVIMVQNKLTLTKSSQFVWTTTYFSFSVDKGFFPYLV